MTGEHLLHGWENFDHAVKLIERETGCLPDDARTWLRGLVQDGSIGARQVRSGEVFPPTGHASKPKSRTRPVPDRSLLVRAADVRARLPEFPPDRRGPGYLPEGGGERESGRIDFDDIVRLYAERVHESGADFSLNAVWRWVHQYVDAGLIAVLGSKADCDTVKDRGLLVGCPGDFFGGADLSAALGRVEFLKEEVFRWLPGHQAAEAGCENKTGQAGPKPRWDWTPIIAKAAVNYHISQQSNKPLYWKQLRDHICDLAERQNGTRPGPSTAAPFAKAIMQAIGKNDN